MLRTFLVDGRLTAIPAKRSKRLVLLDVLAQEFDLGRRYPEAEVNERLRPFHEDVAALRRYLVDEGFLDRDTPGIYWRSGGSYEPERRRAPRIALAPEGVRPWLADAVVAGGGELVAPEAAEALVWAEPGGSDDLGALLDAHPNLAWVQLPWAGIEPYVATVAERPDRTWTCGKGVYAEPVAELALTLLLGGLRGVDRYAKARSWSGPRGVNLLGAPVVVLGGGGITESLLRLLGPFECDVTVVRRRVEPMRGAARVVGPDGLDDALDGAAGLVVAAALTPDTVGIVDRARMDLLGPDGCLVNVGRGRHVVTDDLVAALREGTLGSAGLDVTDPEPLPDGHALWDLPGCVLTPHVGNTPEMAVPLLSERIAANVRRWAAGDPLLGLVDPASGY